MSVLIKGGRVITAADDYVGDVYIEDERVSLIGESLDVAADRVIITGVPDIELQIKGGVHGDRATAAMVVNCIPRVVTARPGVLTMDDIPVSFR